MARSNNAMRLLGWALGGIAIGALLAFLAVNIVARTSAGHERVLKLTLSALGKSIGGGALVVERIEGNLFEGARLYGLSLRDTRGRAFILADSAHGHYDVRTLLSPRIVIDSLVLFDPEIHVFKFPGDSLWNYQAIFADTTRKDTTRPPGPERLVWFGRAKLVNATIRMETPFRPDTTLPAAQQRRLLREALSDSSPVVIRQVPGGYVRTVDIRQVQMVMHDSRFAPGSPRGSRFHIDTLQGNVHFYREPIRIRHLQGMLALFNDHVEFDAPLARLPNSRLATSGVVRFSDFPEWFDPREAPMYDVAVRGDSVAFQDLRWLYPRFPADARGSLSLLIESRPGGVMIGARNTRITAPGTRLAGSFGMILGDTLQFVDVDMEARPIRTSFIERMLPDGMPVRGLVLGGVEIRGDQAAAREGGEEEPGET